MRTLLVVLAAVSVGVGISLGFATIGKTSAPKANCATLSVGVNTDHNIAYDPNTGTLAMQYYNAAGHLEDAVVDANDPACLQNPGVGRAIAHARAAARDVHVGECAEMKAALNGDVLPAKGGVKPNLAAAKTFVSKEC
jgi:hypothetical protein